MKYEYGKIIVPVKANLDILEEPNASESLKKEDATTGTHLSYPHWSL